MPALAMLRSRQRHTKPQPAHRSLEAQSRLVSRPSPGHPEEPCQLPEAKDHTSAAERRAAPRYRRLSAAQVCFVSRQESEILKLPENYGENIISAQVLNFISVKSQCAF